MSHDNPMTIGFIRDEMTLKATLCVTSLEKRLQPLMTSMTIGVFFFMRIILCHRTSSLLMKHVDAPKSSNVLISIIMDLLYLIMISNKKQGVRSKGKLEPF
jgi:hypothetical protein